MVEIRFGCPVCQKYFNSLNAAQNHVYEHKQAWKCGHCVMLFGSPVLALQHWKEIHPGLEGRLESLDSPTLVVEKLFKGITVNRHELNAKSQAKDKFYPSSTHQDIDASGTNQIVSTCYIHL